MQRFACGATGRKLAGSCLAVFVRARVLAAACLLALLCGLVCCPAIAHADDGEFVATFNDGPIDVSWYVFHQDEDTYVIETEEQFAGMGYLMGEATAVYYDSAGKIIPKGSQDVAGSVLDPHFAGKTVLLAADLDLSGYFWHTPIANNYGSRYFSGLFDGQGHVISGMRGDGPSLFGVVRKGVIQNLTVEGSLDSNTDFGTTTQGSAGVVGSVWAGGIYDCTSRVDISFNYVNQWNADPNKGNTGGVVGAAGSMVTGSIVVGTDDEGKDIIKSLSTGSSIVGCVFEGSIVTRTQYAGGIVGVIGSESDDESCVTEVRNCWNKGDVRTDSTKNDSCTVGGVVGAADIEGRMVVSGCVNAGTVVATGAASCAGLVGGVGVNDHSSAKLLIENCAQLGDVTTAAGNASGVLSYERGSRAAAGGASATSPALSVRNCYLAGAILSSGGRESALCDHAILPVLSSAETGWFNNLYLGDETLPLFGNADGEWPATCAKRVSSSELASADAVEQLGEEFAASPDGDEGPNGAYPILQWQNPARTYQVLVRAVVVDGHNDEGSAPRVTLSDDDGNELGSKDMQLSADGKSYEARFPDVAPGQYVSTVQKRGYVDSVAAVIVNTADVVSPQRLVSERYRVTVAVEPDTAKVTMRDSEGNKLSPTSSTVEGGRVVWSYALVNGSYAFEAHAFGHIDSGERAFEVSYGPREESISLEEASPSNQVFEIDAPEGVAFGDHDPVLYLYHDDELCFSVQGETGFSGEGAGETIDQDAAAGEGRGSSHTPSQAVAQIDLPVGTYRYVVKAAGCETLEGALALSADSTTPLRLKPQQAWDGAQIDRRWFDNHLEEDDLYLRTPADIAALSRMTDPDQSMRFEGKRLHVLGNMDFGGNGIHSIGYMDGINAGTRKPFSGEFDGGSFKLSNMTIAKRTKSDGGVDQTIAAGFFGSLANASVHDVVLDGVHVTGFGSYYTAGLAGCVFGSTIRSCDVTADVACSNQGCGIVCGLVESAGAPSSIVDCTAHGTLAFQNQSGSHSDFGGIAGHIGDGCSIIDCVNEADISIAFLSGNASWVGSYANAGGIVGAAHGGSFTIRGCVNKGTVEADRGRVAGVVGSVSSTASVAGEGPLVANCANEGTVACTAADSSDAAIGGVVGVTGTLQHTSITVQSCWNRGVVRNTAPTRTAVAAGIVGKPGASMSDLSIKNCYNTGIVEATGDSSARAAGIVGTLFSDVTVANCYAAGSVSARSATRSGAIATGATKAATALVSNCYYLEGSARRAFDSTADVEGVSESRSSAFMQSGPFVSELNIDGVYAADERNENDGYPVIGKADVEWLTSSSFFLPSTLTYKGEPQVLDIVVHNAVGDVLVQGDDYTVSYMGGDGKPIEADGICDVGKYAVSVTGCGKYAGTVSRRLEVSATLLPRSAFDVSHEIRYTGKAPTVQDVLVTDMREGKDYEASLFTVNDDCISVGTHEIKVEGLGNYETNGSYFFLEFEILPGLVSVSDVESVTYTGEARTPKVSVVNSDGETLTLGSEYSVEFHRDGAPIDASDVCEPGVYSVVVTGQGNYAGSVDEKPFEISRAGITVGQLPEVAYTGEPVAIAPVVSRSGSNDVLEEGLDYTVEVFDQDGEAIDRNAVVEVGSYRVVVNGIGNYEGSREVGLNVVSSSFEVDPVASVRYNGKAQVPDLIVRAVKRSGDSEGDGEDGPATESTLELVAGSAVGLGPSNGGAPTGPAQGGALLGRRLTEGVDYTVGYGRVDADTGEVEWGIGPEDLVDAASYRIEVTGIGGLEGTINVVYDINPAQLVIANEIAPLGFKAQPLEVPVDVEGVLEGGQAALTLGDDYEASYSYRGMSIDASQIIHAGSYEVSVEGKGNYAGSVDRRSFAVEPAVLSLDEIPDAVYDGSVLVPELVARAGEVVLPQEYYQVEYRVGSKASSYKADRSRLVVAGSYLIRVTPVESVRSDFANGGNMAEAEYRIVPAPLAVEASDLVYTGSGQTPVLSVRSGERVLTASEYRASFYTSAGRYAGIGSVIEAGDYIVRIVPTASGCYEVDAATGAVSAEFSVKKAPVSLDSIEALTYTGKALSPKVVVRSGSRTLDAREYTVQYLNASGARVYASQVKDASRYTVRIALVNAANYEQQTLSTTFDIVKPAGSDNDDGSHDGSGNVDGGGKPSSESSGGSTSGGSGKKPSGGSSADASQSPGGSGGAAKSDTGSDSGSRSGENAGTRSEDGAENGGNGDGDGGQGSRESQGGQENRSGQDGQDGQGASRDGGAEGGVSDASTVEAGDASGDGSGDDGWGQPYESTGTDGTPAGTEWLGSILISTPVSDSEFDDEDFSGLRLGKYDDGSGSTKSDGSTGASGAAGSQSASAASDKAGAAGAGGTSDGGASNGGSGTANAGGGNASNATGQAGEELVDAVQQAMTSESKSGALTCLAILLIALPTSYYYLFRRRRRDEGEVAEIMSLLT